MATVAIVLNTSKKLSNNEYAVTLRVIENRKPRYIALSTLIKNSDLNFRCSTDNWRPPAIEDNGLGCFLKSVARYRELNTVLAQKLLDARRIITEYEEAGLDFTFERFEEDIRTGNKSQIKRRKSLLLKDYYLSIIQELEQNQKIGLASIFQSTLSSLEHFRPNALITDVNVKFLEAFEAWLKTVKKNKDTSISVKIRNLQRALNLAIADKLFRIENYPFGEKKYSVNKRQPGAPPSDYIIFWGAHDVHIRLNKVTILLVSLVHCPL